MAKLLITGTHGAEDPTRASMPFHIAKGAKEAGFDVDIVLANDAPVVLKDAVRDSLQGVGLPPLKDLLQFAVDNNLRVYV
jgi:predicted peroxiredoxin